MQITLIRHLPTEWNKKHKLQGKRDIGIAPITEETHKAIHENKQQLTSKAPFDLVLASTLKRTHQTARLYGYSPETDSLLDELDFGPFEGQTKSELIQEYGEIWLENPIDLVLGESIKNLEQRIVQFLEKYHGVKKVLVFGHGSWIRAFISYSKVGHVNEMNKIIVDNNECIDITF